MLPRLNGQRLHLHLPVPGLHMVQNAVLAVAAARAFGVSIEDSATGLASTPLTKARFTADATPVTNMDAGVKDSRFWLVTGGEVRNQMALKSLIEVESKSSTSPELP